MSLPRQEKEEGKANKIQSITEERIDARGFVGCGSIAAALVGQKGTSLSETGSAHKWLRGGLKANPGGRAAWEQPRGIERRAT
ncbi:hypothetical protein TgHK011_007285 [Trichoderma gracile]|nr:hypothetical protein TgHK011_007285 [Trichoderma gracile]